MCVIAVTKPGAKLSPAQLTAMFENNRDGAGMAFIKDNKVAIHKGYMALDGFLAAYNEYYEKYGKDNPMLVHCRIRTHGARNAAMTHPFVLPDGGALVHNGSFTGLQDDEKSDTCIFVNRVGHALTKESLSNEAVLKKLGSVLGHNKVAVLHPDGSYTIVNESAGSWIGDAWFSNSYWQYRMGKGTSDAADPWASWTD